jgi:hypothetical protein
MFSGSGFVNYCDPDPFINKQKKMKKNLDFYYLRHLCDFLSLKNDVNVPSKRNMHKKRRKKLIFVGFLKVTGEKKDSDPDPRIRIHNIRICTKCHISETLLIFTLKSDRLVILEWPEKEIWMDMPRRVHQRFTYVLQF